MKPLIRIAHNAGRGTYGPRRIQTELESTGTFMGRDQIARVRREMRMKCIQKRKFKVTTNSAHSLRVVENLLDQQFTVSDPGTVYGTDEGWLYLAGVKDLATREIIGHSMASRMTRELTHTALDRAVRYRKPEPGCIHHSDRGSPYCAISYPRAVVALGRRPSMSCKGNCYDNAPVAQSGLLTWLLTKMNKFRC